MQIRLLGSGAGNGFPAWNGGSEADARARSGDPARPLRRGAALAVSPDGQRYSLLEAPLHLPGTLALDGRFAPPAGSAATPIDTLVLTSAEPEASAGLLGFGASLSFRVASPRGLRESMTEHDLSFRAFETIWSGFGWDRPIPLDRDGVLEARFFPLPGEPPLHLRDQGTKAGRSRCGLRITDQRTGGRLVWAPRISKLDSATLEELRLADLRFVDGTRYSASDLAPGQRRRSPPAAGASIPIDGRDGSLAWLSGLRGESVYVHFAGDNPASFADAPEFSRTEAAGVRIPSDGEEWTL